MNSDDHDGNEGNVRPLFRQQVHHAVAGQYGSILLTRPLSSSLLTLASVAVATGVIGFFLLFSTSRKVECHGTLAPISGILRLVPSQPGVVKEIRIHEGQQVLQGDLLFMVSADKDGLHGMSTQLALAALLRQRRESMLAEIELAVRQSHDKEEASRRRESHLQAEGRAIRTQILLQKKRIELIEDSRQRLGTLRQQNFVSDAQLRSKEEEILEARLKLADLERSEMAIRRDSADAHSAWQDFRWQRQRESSSLNRNIAEVEQSLTLTELGREAWMVAPKNGTISGITAVVGQTVATDTQLAALASNNDELVGELYVPSHAVGFLTPKLPVVLRYRAFPYQKYGQYAASVIDVSATPVDSTVVNKIFSKGDEERSYRVRLKLKRQSITVKGQEFQLRPGMSFDATIHLESRLLWEWILEPVYSLTRKGI